MWIICGAISIIFCIGGWILKIKESDRAVLSAVCSLAFVIATLLVQYQMALNWVIKRQDSVNGYYAINACNIVCVCCRFDFGKCDYNCR